MEKVTRPHILVLPPPTLYRKLFAPESDARLRELGTITYNGDERDLTNSDLVERIGLADVVITGWRCPAFTEDVLAAAPRLKLIAHSAGSVKFMFPGDADALSRGFTVTTAAAAMGASVAEFSLLMTLMLLRPIHQLDAGLHAKGDWGTFKARGSGEELAAQRVGVIGAGHTGRHYIRLLRAMGVETWVFDPYLTEARAAQMDVERVTSLDELLASCRVIALHAPATPQTYRMIGKREFDLMKDDACFVNTARSSLVDPEAMLAELRKGRISAALDVFDDEPLPVDSPLRSLSNVILTPHVASHTVNTHFRQGELTVDEVQRFVRGEPLRYAVTPEMLATMA
ncbi:MAG: hydroxyacid dehydrogenase [Planctomycetota bacterium]|nr:hydroxyacid dehydrogenase [Planctomycetota bacterium]